MPNGRKLDKWWRKIRGWMGKGNATEIGSEEITSSDVVIAVMGPTGAGKTTFIETICGAAGRAGHSLASRTQEISVFGLSFPEHPDFRMCFVDTPGFDNANRTDLETFEMISNWMIKTYKRHIPLGGVVYCHRITDNRMGSTQVKNLGFFEKLCGEDTKIVLATTMWDNVDEATGKKREQELREMFWKSMIERGSSVKRFLRNRNSAMDVLAPIFDEIHERSARNAEEPTS